MKNDWRKLRIKKGLLKRMKLKKSRKKGENLRI